jgi:hypothetical protein
MRMSATLVPIERIESRILVVRGYRVMLDSDLAELYRISTGRLNEQVKRNRNRFPKDFMFQLTKEETKILRSQSAISKDGRGGRRYQPNAFTEHGAVMLASVLNSPVAVQASIQVVRAFLKLRAMLSTQQKLALKLLQLEKRLGDHDDEITTLFRAIRQLMEPQSKSRKAIGFHS